ncbi:HAD-IB family hydrolase [Candidatus Symbiothrix dinenymphae]|uniref:HAD-IB family hydrolase n=1 Tax=Candidatus Symbiothrix dinenymphae TaxID=467085 RepID=UPI0006C1A4BF|nr:HAD-IB family hydrolase [Candidatus Symbiothrix dinenymphae]GAP71455.1 phosphoserine phosphatase [Candidatus Symbiothrix dinenymphae]
MKVKQTVAAFDFDGTITTRDSLLEFISFAKGPLVFLWGFLLFSPLLIACKLRLYPNWKAKQRLFSFFFTGMKLHDFNQLCDTFCQQSMHLIRRQAISSIQKHIEKGDSVLIISASIENWVRPFAEYLGISNILCTQLEIDQESCLTGRFADTNCYGAEKKRRLLQLYPHRGEYRLATYGDCKGDKALFLTLTMRFPKQIQKK